MKTFWNPLFFFLLTTLFALKDGSMELGYMVRLTMRLDFKRM